MKHYKTVLLIKQLQELRQKQNLTQVELARMIGVSDETINRIEKFACSTLAIDRLMAIADVLGYELIAQPRKNKRTKKNQNYVQKKKH